MSFFNPRLFIISAPSGTGKSSVFAAAKEILPILTLSVSYTTRDPRPGEKDGEDYFFITKADFQERIAQDEFLEWAEVYGNYYGTSKKFIADANQSGRIVILDIDVQGAMQLKNIPDLDAEFLFIVPPSLETLRDRLESRGTESPESLRKRLGNAEHELSFKKQYDYVIMNDDLDEAVDQTIFTVLQACLTDESIRSLPAQEVLNGILPEKDQAGLIASSRKERLLTTISKISHPQ